MEAGRHTWTDSRLDDLQQEMRAGFARVDADLRSLRSDVNGVNGRIDALQRTMLQVGGGMIVAQLALMVTILGLVLTRL